MPNLYKRKSASDISWGSEGKEARVLEKFRQLLGRLNEEDRKLVFFVAQKMARGKSEGH